MRLLHQNNGFHLLEILITLSIIAIISTWATSHYQTLIASTHRRETEHALIALASALESYALENGSYADASLIKLKISPHTANKTYKLKIQSATDRSFKISAEPLHQQAAYDNFCGTLSLTSTGEKSNDGAAEVKDCW